MLQNIPATHGRRQGLRLDELPAHRMALFLALKVDILDTISPRL